MKRNLVISSLTLVLLFGNIPSLQAQVNYDEFSPKLVLAPSHVNPDFEKYSYGYVYLINKEGIPVNPPEDIQIELESEASSIASVPPSVVFNKEDSFSQFKIEIGSKTGKSNISAKLGSNIVYETLQVGTTTETLPDDIKLEINIPSEDMHVNTNMPFSVLLKSSKGDIIRAPYDVPIVLEFEDSLATPEPELLTIKKGNYYAWGTINTHEKTGSTFLRAIQPDTGLDVAKNIKISSSLPAKIELQVFPKIIPATGTRHIDMFVTLLDSQGNPAITPKSIPLEFFSDQQEYIQESLDKTMKERNLVIKEGEFGFYHSQEIGLHLLRSRGAEDFIANNIMIGVNAHGLGSAVDSFTPIGESLSIGDKKVKQTNIELFTVDKIPSKASAVVGYQMKTLENNDDDPKDIEECSIEEKLNQDKTNKEDCIIFNIDMLKDNEEYPIQAGDYYSTKTDMMTTVVSDDQSIIKIVEHGTIRPASSFGSATIESGDKTGRAKISVSINGVGSTSKEIEVINPLEQQEIRIFSPTGDDTILFDKDGNFDIFLVAIDSNNRPKIMENPSKYLVTPTNQPIEIESGMTYTKAKLRSDSFNLASESSITLAAKPIGEDVDMSIETSKEFLTQPTSKLSLTLPINNLNIENQNHIGIVQLVDQQGNPQNTLAPIQVKIASTNPQIVKSNTNTIIEKNSSFATFLIETPGDIGETTLSVSAKGIVGDSTSIKTASYLTKLKIFANGLGNAFSVGESKSIKLFVDDENARSVPGAYLKIESDENVSISPKTVRTNGDGSVTVNLKAVGGPRATFSVFAEAEGYEPGRETFIATIETQEEQPTPEFPLNFPDWILYAVMGGVLLIGIMVFLFIKKSKVPIEEYEEEEI